MITLTAGTVASCCVCRSRCSTWWRGGDFYAAVHEGCAEKLAAECSALTGRAAAGTEVAPVRRGAYARRAGRGVVAQFVPSWFPAAYDAWLVLAETNTGQVAVPCGGNAGHGVAALRSYRLLTEQGRPIMSLASAGALAVGAALFTPERKVAVSWGYVPTIGVPAWEPLRIVASWGVCTTCDAWLWPGRWVTSAHGRCVLCAAGDGRSWPVEPDFPGDNSVPEHMREEPAAHRPRRAQRAVKYAGDHA